MKYTLIMTARARGDFVDILQFTLAHWGESKLIAYRDTLHAALQTIKAAPYHHRARDDLWVCNAGKHHIYYRVITSNIYILRILHERMDTTKHLPQ